MKRRYILPAAVTVFAAGLALPLWKPKTIFAQPDSPIVVGDASSIHFRRIVAGDLFQPAGARWRVAEGSRQSATIEIATATPRVRNLSAGWSVKLMDGGTEVGSVSSSDNHIVLVDPEGHASPGGAAAEVVIPSVHLRSIQLQNAGSSTPFTCPANAECFRIHYR